MKPYEAVGGRLRHLLITCLGWGVALAFFTPLIWALLSSFKTNADAQTDPPTFFFAPTVENYENVLSGEFSHFFINSVIVTVTATLICLIVAYPVAYALAIRPVKRWRDVLFFLMSTRLMPVVGSIVPLYILAKNLDLLDSRVTLIILYTTMNLPIAVWLLRAYIRQVPVSTLEAAQLDGASPLRELTRILLPMTLPGLAATGMLCTIFCWHEFMIGVSLTTYSAATLPVYLPTFVSGRGLYIAELSTVAVLMTIPVLIGGWLAQRRIIQGFALLDEH